MERNGKALCIVDDRVNHARRQRLRWIDRNAVARVNTGALDVLHDARDDNIHTIGDGIDLDLRSLHIAIDEDRMIRRHLDRAAHVVAQLLLVVDNLHRTPPEDV